MKSSRFTEEQIIGILKQGEGGMKVGEICREQGICDQTYYRWKAKYGGLEVSEAQRLRQLEDENRRLKQTGAGLMNARRQPRRGVNIACWKMPRSDSQEYAAARSQPNAQRPVRASGAQPRPSPAGQFQAAGSWQVRGCSSST